MEGDHIHENYEKTVRGRERCLCVGGVCVCCRVGKEVCVCICVVGAGGCVCVCV